LGNQVLLAADDNSVVGSEGFSTKRQALLRSTFTTTKEAGATMQWTPKEIDERQRQLAALAVRVFPLTGEIRRRKAVAKRVGMRRASKKK
jgi:hypothetical protein